MKRMTIRGGPIILLIQCAGCAGFIPPPTQQQLSQLSDEDLKAVLYLSGGTRDWTWERNKPERQAILDEVDRRHLMTVSQVNTMFSKSKVNWPNIGQTMEDVLVEAGEPSRKSIPINGREMWVYLISINGRRDVIQDEKRICFISGKVTARSFVIERTSFGEHISQSFIDSEC